MKICFSIWAFALCALSAVAEQASPALFDCTRGQAARAPIGAAFLADVPSPEPAQFHQWLLSAFAVLSIAALVKQFARKTPIEAEFLTKREFADFKDKEFADLRNRVDQSYQALANKLDFINDRLHEVRSLVDRLDERTKNLNALREHSNPS